ncbi:hypothetical protein GCM10023083_40910 [Streptomyces phyllanthi]
MAYGPVEGLGTAGGIRAVEQPVLEVPHGFVQPDEALSGAVAGGSGALEPEQDVGSRVRAGMADTGQQERGGRPC